jgi:tRNA(Ile)-lysidine synthase
VWRDEHGTLEMTATVTGCPPQACSADCVLRGAGGEQEFENVQFGWRIRAGSLPRRTRVESEAGLEQFDADQVGRRITLRHWTPGDRFQPIGLGGPTRLQDLFTNAKVPRAERHRRVVGVTEAGEVFWVEGLRIGDRFKLTKDTRRILVWRWRRRGQGG